LPLVEARRWPSRLKATASTLHPAGPLPSGRPSCRWLLTFQRRTIPCVSPEARVRPSGLKAMELTPASAVRDRLAEPSPVVNRRRMDGV
jgi:hypothetical protein